MKNVYFVHIPKAAGISMKQAFLNKYMFGGADLFNPNSELVRKNPTLKRTLREYVQGKKYSSFGIGNDSVMNFGKHENIYEKIKDVTPKFVFTFVRNPWDRFVSLYFYAQKEGYFKPELSFSDLVHRVYENNDLEGLFQPNVPDTVNVQGLQSQFKWISDPKGNLYTDFIGRYENIQEDFDKVCQLIGVNAMKLHVANSSQHPAYRDCYTDETARMVGEIYEKDVNEFKYAF